MHMHRGVSHCPARASRDFLGVLQTGTWGWICHLPPSTFQRCLEDDKEQPKPRYQHEIISALAGVQLGSTSGEKPSSPEWQGILNYAEQLS